MSKTLSMSLASVDMNVQNSVSCAIGEYGESQSRMDVSRVYRASDTSVYALVWGPVRNCITDITSLRVGDEL